MMPMIAKLTRYAPYEGHCLPRASRRLSPRRCGGTRRSSTRSVIAMAKTPSLNASSRPLGNVVADTGTAWQLTRPANEIRHAHPGGEFVVKAASLPKGRVSHAWDESPQGAQHR